jgi:hypothetical protein
MLRPQHNNLSILPKNKSTPTYIILVKHYSYEKEDFKQDIIGGNMRFVNGKLRPAKARRPATTAGPLIILSVIARNEAIST